MHSQEKHLSFMNLFGWALLVDVGYALFALVGGHPSLPQFLARLIIGAAYSAVGAAALFVVLERPRKDN